MKKVVIVTSGEWGIVPSESYARFVQLIKDHLARANEKYKEQRRTDLDEFQVEEAETSEDALKHFYVGDQGSLIFISRGKQKEAEEIAKNHPELQVCLFTGLIPEGRVCYIRKTWIGSDAQVDDFLS